MVKWFLWYFLLKKKFARSFDVRVGEWLNIQKLLEVVKHTQWNRLFYRKGGKFAQRKRSKLHLKDVWKMFEK